MPALRTTLSAPAIGVSAAVLKYPGHVRPKFPQTSCLRRSAHSRPRRAAGAPAPTVRLNKRMADLGLCSRREADDWIARGWVLVNGEPAVMGMPVAPDARIEVAPGAPPAGQQVTILLNKPMGYVSGQAEDGHEPAVTLISPQNHWRDDATPQRFAPEQLRGLAPAGRLDIDSIGLLVLTQDGRVARQLIGEDSAWKRNTWCACSYGAEGDGQRAGERFPRDKLARLRHGLSLDGQPLQARAGGLAEPRAAALRADRRQEAPDPPHVRAGRA